MVAQRRDRLVERRRRKLEGERHLAPRPRPRPSHREPSRQALPRIAESDAVARFSRFAGRASACQRGRRCARSASPRPAHARRHGPPPELGRDHLGVVEDERVTRPQQARQVAHRAIGQRRGSQRIDHQQPRRVARGRRAERDQLLGNESRRRRRARPPALTRRLKLVSGDPHRSRSCRGSPAVRRA